METFKKRQVQFLIQLIGFSIVLFALHSCALNSFVEDTVFFFPAWQIYTFHLVVTLLFYTTLNYRYSTGKKDVLNLFMILTFVKMVLSILFLLPMLLSDIASKQPDIINFFIPYFLFLFFEVFALTKLLSKK